MYTYNRIDNWEDVMEDQKYVELPVDLIDYKENNQLIFGDDEVNKLDNKLLLGSMNRVGFHGVIEVIQCENGRYKVIAGNRRLSRYIEAGKKFIPSVILNVKDEKEANEIFIESNLLQRKLTPLMTGYALKTYMDDCLDSSLPDYEKRKIIRERFGYSDTTIKRYVRLTSFIPELQKVTSYKNFPYHALTDAKLSEQEQKTLVSYIEEEYDKQLSELKKNDPEATKEDVTITKSFILYTLNGLKQERKRAEEREKQDQIKYHKETLFEQISSTTRENDSLPLVQNVSDTIKSDEHNLYNNESKSNPDMRVVNRLNSSIQERSNGEREVVAMTTNVYNDVVDKAIDMWNQQFDQLMNNNSIEIPDKKATLKKLDTLQMRIDKLRKKLSE